jgi:four helix bundle protein
MNEKLKNFKELIVWQKAYKLTLEIYKITAGFPKDEQYGLSAQMRRAAVSVVSNIAEGYTRKGIGEYINFLSIAYASLAELETQVLLSEDLSYLKGKAKMLLSLKDEVGAMLFRMQQRLQGSGYRGQGIVKKALNSAPRFLNPAP